jgi:hypothetical protein
MVSTFSYSGTSGLQDTDISSILKKHNTHDSNGNDIRFSIPPEHFKDNDIEFKIETLNPTTSFSLNSSGAINTSRLKVKKDDGTFFEVSLTNSQQSNDQQTGTALTKSLPMVFVLSSIILTTSGLNSGANNNALQMLSNNSRIVSSVQPSEANGRARISKTSDRFEGTLTKQIEFNQTSKPDSEMVINKFLEISRKSSYITVIRHNESTNFSEGLEMDNHFFDVVGDRLYKTGFLFFGIAAILLLILWGMKILPFEIGFIGFTMSSFSIILLISIRFLFGRFSDGTRC